MSNNNDEFFEGKKISLLCSKSVEFDLRDKQCVSTPIFAHILEHYAALGAQLTLLLLNLQPSMENSC